MDLRDMAVARSLRRLARRSTLRRQLLLVIFATLGLAFVTSYWVNTRVEARAFEEVRAYVESTSRAVQVSVNLIRDRGSPVEIITFETEAVPAGIRRLTLRDPDGRILAQSSEPGPSGDEVVDPADFIDYRVPLMEAGRLIGYMDVELTTSGLRTIFREMITSKVVLWSVIFVLGILLLVPVASAVSQSQRQVERVVASVAAGDLDPQFPEPMSREADTLFMSFRTLLSRLRQQREMEVQLRRAEREASIGRMTSGVAHDIRNPLNYVELAVGELWDRRRTLGQPGAEEAALYDGIKQELHRVNEITVDLLAFGRPLIPQLRPEQVASLLAQCIEDLERRNPERRADVTAELPDEGVWLSADRDLMQRILTNAVDNALDATEPGDPVRLGCVAEGNEMVTIWIEDSGPGVPEEVIEHMFEPYITGKPSGTGLGLALAYQWVQDMGGDISVRNVADGGARVEIRLPRVDGKEADGGKRDEGS